MLTMHRASWPKLYADCLREAFTEGWTRPSREGETIELGPATVSTRTPLFQIIQGRGGSSEFARIEQLGHLAGVPPDDLERLAPHFTRFADPDGTYPWAYGPRLSDQLPFVVEELHRRPFSRRAVATIWHPEDAKVRMVNKPCALNLVFWIGPAGEVRCHAITRSCDLWYGFYYDMPTWSILQRAVAKALRRSYGQTYQTATSFHLYSRHLAPAKAVVAKTMEDPVNQTLPDPPDGLEPMERWFYLKGWAMDQLGQFRLEVVQA